MKLSTYQKAICALILANVVWGCAPPIFKWALHDISPMNLAFYRFLLSTIITFPFVMHNFKIQPKDYFKIFIIGITGVTINIIFFFYGLSFAPSINASIIGSAGPLILIFAAMIFLKEKLRKKLLIGSLIGLVGVMLIILKPAETQTESSKVILGNLFYVIGLFASVIQTVVSKPIMKRYDPMVMTFWTFLIGTLGFTPLYYAEGIKHGFIPQFSVPVITALAFGALLSSLLAYFLSYWALKHLPAEEVGIFVYLDPVVTILLAIPLLGEYPDFLFSVGALFVFGGIFIAEGRLHYHPVHKLRRRK